MDHYHQPAYMKVAAVTEPERARIPCSYANQAWTRSLENFEQRLARIAIADDAVASCMHELDGRSEAQGTEDQTPVPVQDDVRVEHRLESSTGEKGDNVVKRVHVCWTAMIEQQSESSKRADSRKSKDWAVRGCDTCTSLSVTP